MSYHRVNVLVAKAFCKNDAGDKAEVHHRNDIKACNWSTNLEWLTRSDHAKQTIQSGLHVSLKGEEHAQAKLTTADVLEIRARAYRHGDHAKWAKEFGVSDVLISRIRKGQIWKHLKAPKKPSVSAQVPAVTSVTVSQ